ncbi:hypothetical protein PsYK624_039090 [Phanerochaete sordida]|uniref:Uncharacterized protein n=1 Tax=Phanerochaete sordida TaxID=48140 RepID=A0A9P3G410_9APHY|nr:hypothetical protein PsYK624_039090 [Phanerochaete sordida]
MHTRPALRADARAWTLAAAAGLLWTQALLPAVRAADSPYLPQGFYFDWTPPGQSPPVPTTAQCETIHIEYSRGAATGPNPVAPYYLQVYTSTFIVPFVIQAGLSDSDLSFDWPVPFIPGTQYQICMFDSNGVTGGCQATYSVYTAPNTSFQDPPVCTNLSYPHPDQVLGVTSLVDNGPLGQFAWIPECTDISVQPTNGTPPYTLTVAPALHPPYNITSNTMDPINWTVSLSWGTPFFISLADSSGMTWAYGPLHSAQGTDTTCLSELTTIGVSHKEVQPWVAAVSGVGGVVVGLLIGVLGAMFLATRRRRSHRRDRLDTLHRKSSSVSVTTPVLHHPSERYSDMPTLPTDLSYQIEPFVMPSELGAGTSASSPSNTMFDTAHTRNTTALTTNSARSRSPPASFMSPTSTAPPASIPLLPPHPPLSAENRTPSQVFVVHHDGGRPPVTVYAADGTEIVELPPRYVDSNSNSNHGAAGSTGSSSDASMRPGPGSPLQPQRRQPGAAPPKTQRRVAS